MTCNASAANEVGPKKAKRPAGKQQQQQPEKLDRHQHQQQHSSEWLMDMDADSDDAEDNFLVRCRGAEAFTRPTVAFNKLVR